MLYDWLGRDNPLAPQPHPTPPKSGGKCWCRGHKSGELILPLTDCSTRESGSCMSPGQHSRVDPIDQGTSDLPLKMCVRDLAAPFICHKTEWVKERRPPLFTYTSLPVVIGRAGSVVLRVAESFHPGNTLELTRLAGWRRACGLVSRTMSLSLSLIYAM